MASIEAVQRRRDNRKSRRVARERRSQMQAERFAARVLVRYFHDRAALSLLQLDARYWQLRRCGWDPMADIYRPERVVMVNGVEHRRRPEPTETELWRWWSRLTFLQRDEIVLASRAFRHRV